MTEGAVEAARGGRTRGTDNASEGSGSGDPNLLGRQIGSNSGNPVAGSGRNGAGNGGAQVDGRTQISGKDVIRCDRRRLDSGAQTSGENTDRGGESHIARSACAAYKGTASENGEPQLDRSAPRTNGSAGKSGEVQVAGCGGVPSKGIDGGGWSQDDKSAQPEVAKESTVGNSTCQDGNRALVAKGSNGGDVGDRVIGDSTGGCDETQASCEPRKAHEKDSAEDGESSNRDEEIAPNGRELRVRQTVIDKFARSGVNRGGLGQLGVVLTENAREKLQNRNISGTVSFSRQHAENINDAEVEEGQAPEVEEAELDQLREQFLQEHNTLESHLQELPSDPRLFGLWPGLVLRYDLLMPLAKAYANRNGEALDLRIDHTGSNHQRVSCIYSGHSRRRVEVGKAKRLRATVRDNCAWGANFTVLNFHKVRAEHPGARPRDIHIHFIARVSRWHPEHSGHAPAKLLSGRAEQDLRAGREIADRFGKEISVLYASGVKPSAIRRVIAERHRVNVRLQGVHNALQLLFPRTDADAEDMIKEMKRLVGSGELAPESRYGVDPTLKILNYSLFVTNKAVMLGRKISDIVIFDTTAKVTRYGFYTGIFTGIDPEFRSRTLAVAFIISESEFYFCRLFNDFCDIFGEINLLMTDDDRAIESALKSCPRIKNHGLCGWHILKNLRKKVVPLMPKVKKNSVVGDFLDVARSGSEEVFEATWRSFLEKYIPDKEAEAAAEKPVTNYMEFLYERREKWEANFFASSGIATLSIESTQRAERMNRVLKENTRPTFPLVKILMAILKIQREESEKGMILDNLHASRSHLVRRDRDADLERKLREAGFGPSSERLLLIKHYSRFALAYVCWETHHLPGFEVADGASFIRRSNTGDFREVFIFVQRAECPERSITKTALKVTPSGSIRDGSCECLAPQQIQLPCRHLFFALSFISNRLMKCPLRGGVQDFDVVKVSATKVSFFRSLAGERWKWEGEESMVRRESSVGRTVGPMIITFDSPSATLDDENEQVEARNDYSDISRCRRYAEIMSISKKVAAFSCENPSVFLIVKRALGEITETSEYFLRDQKPPSKFKVAAAAHEQYAQERGLLNVQNQSAEINDRQVSVGATVDERNFRTKASSSVPAETIRPPAVRKNFGPNSNIHKRREYRPGILSRSRNFQNQVTPFRSDRDQEVITSFIKTLEGTPFGHLNRNVFKSTAKKWPCLYRLMGKECTSARGTRGLTPFAGLKGVAKHMMVSHGEKLIELAREHLNTTPIQEAGEMAPTEALPSERGSEQRPLEVSEILETDDSLYKNIPAKRDRPTSTEGGASSSNTSPAGTVIMSDGAGEQSDIPALTQTLPSQPPEITLTPPLTQNSLLGSPKGSKISKEVETGKRMVSAPPRTLNDAEKECVQGTASNSGKASVADCAISNRLEPPEVPCPRTESSDGSVQESPDVNTKNMRKALGVSKEKLSQEAKRARPCGVSLSNVLKRKGILSPKAKKIPRHLRKPPPTPAEFQKFLKESGKKCRKRREKYPGEFYGDLMEACSEFWYDSEQEKEDMEEAERMFPE